MNISINLIINTYYDVRTAPEGYLYLLSTPIGDPNCHVLDNKVDGSLYYRSSVKGTFFIIVGGNFALHHCLSSSIYIQHSYIIFENMWIGLYSLAEMVS